MTDLTGKTWMSIGETDDPNAVIMSVEAAAQVTKGDPVYLSADDKVSPASAAQNCLGIAVKSVASGEQCPVLISGRVKVKAGGAINRGRAVYGADASKRVLELTDQAVNEAGSASYTVYYNRNLGTALETTAVAMYSFANSMNSATASVQNFNDTAADMPTRSRSITRAGDDALYRRGVE